MNLSLNWRTREGTPGLFYSDGSLNSTKKGRPDEPWGRITRTGPLSLPLPGGKSLEFGLPRKPRAGRNGQSQNIRGKGGPQLDYDKAVDFFTHGSRILVNFGPPLPLIPNLQGRFMARKSLRPHFFCDKGYFHRLWSYEKQAGTKEDGVMNTRVFSFIEEKFKWITLVLLFAITIGLFLNWAKPQNGRYQMFVDKDELAAWQNDSQTGRIFLYALKAKRQFERPEWIPPAIVFSMTTPDIFVKPGGIKTSSELFDEPEKK